MDAHVWVKHPETGGYWECPVAVLEEMQGKGWVLAEAPEPEDPTTATRRQLLAEQAAAEAAAKQTKPTKAAPRGESTEE